MRLHLFAPPTSPHAEEHGLAVEEVSGEEVVAEAIGKVPQQSAYNRRGEVRVRRAQRRGARL